jgi:hypothetical protein
MGFLEHMMDLFLILMETSKQFLEIAVLYLGWDSRPETLTVSENTLDNKEERKRGRTSGNLKRDSKDGKIGKQKYHNLIWKLT